MSEQYRCNNCGFIVDMKDMMCSECGIGYLERLRWTKGGDGSHWEGCADVHWDCKIEQLEAELARRDASLLTEGEQKEILSYIQGNYDRDKIPTWLLDLIDGIARRDEIIARLKEDAERLADCVENSRETPNSMCLVQHRALMKKLEEK